jgi:pre-60S factor REI1
MDNQRASGAQAQAYHYTCNTCQVAYRTPDLQKGHMKSDWHRYNLKRRVASLPPITAEVFTEKVLQARAASTAEADRATFEKPCDVCMRTYYSENSYQNHLSSQKHRARKAVLDRAPALADEGSSVIGSTFSLGDPLPSEGTGFDTDAEEEFVQVVEGLQKTSLGERPSPVKRPSNPEPRMGEDQEPNTQSGAQGADAEAAQVPTEAATYDLKSCLFCNYVSPTIPLNAHHMERFHGMFIPEKPYLVNLEGLLQHLHRRIHEDYQCLFCGKAKANSFAAQTHMRDTGHCMIPYSTEAEQLDIGDFYDFRSTYTDGEESEDDETKANGETGNGEDDGWETDSDASSVASEDLTAIPAEARFRLDKQKHHPRDDARHHHQADGWHSHAHKHVHTVFHDEYELYLPSGKTVGHRSLNRYYKQNLNRYPPAEERAGRLALEAAKDEDAMDVDSEEAPVKMRNRVRAIVPRGTLGMVGVVEHKKAVARKSEQRGRSLEQFRNKKEGWAVSKGLNNHKSYYYRYNGGG